MAQLEAERLIAEALEEVAEKAREAAGVVEDPELKAKFEQQKQLNQFNIETAEKEIEIIKTSDNFRKIQLQADLERFNTRAALTQEINRINESEFTDEQKRILISNATDQARLELQKINAQEEINFENAVVDAKKKAEDEKTKAVLAAEAAQQAARAKSRKDVSDVLKFAGQFTNSFKSLKNQEINSEIRVAKARGASAKEIEKLERKKFEANKKAQLANAIVNTAANIVEAKPPSPKSIAAGVIGALQIATILKTKFGGGSGGSGGGVSGATSGGTSASGIISTGNATQMDRNIGFLPARGGEFSGAEITIVNTFDEEKVSEVADRGARKRQQQQVVVA